jgi:hypothetical protein
MLLILKVNRYILYQKAYNCYYIQNKNPSE